MKNPIKTLALNPNEITSEVKTYLKWLMIKNLKSEGTNTKERKKIEADALPVIDILFGDDILTTLQAFDLGILAANITKIAPINFWFYFKPIFDKRILK